MPRHCVVAGCDTMGYSFHKFPKNNALQKRWIGAVKRQQSNWDGQSADSQLCSKHNWRSSISQRNGHSNFKADAVPTIFARSVDYLQASCSRSTTPTSSRPLSKKEDSKEWWEHKLYMANCKYTATYVMWNWIHDTNTHITTKIIGCGWTIICKLWNNCEYGWWHGWHNFFIYSPAYTWYIVTGYNNPTQGKNKGSYKLSWVYFKQKLMNCIW